MIVEGRTSRSECVSREALFQGVSTRFWATKRRVAGNRFPLKALEMHSETLVRPPHANLHFYPSQTKMIGEGGTKDDMRMFEALFNGSWPKLSTHALEKCFEYPHFVFCSSFQNLRLGGINYHTGIAVATSR